MQSASDAPGASGGLASGRGEWSKPKFEWLGKGSAMRIFRPDVRTAYRSAFGGVAGTGCPKSRARWPVWIVLGRLNRRNLR